jgi:hypothetical protein
MAIGMVHLKAAAILCAASLVLVAVGCDDDESATPTTTSGTTSSGGGGTGGSSTGVGGTGGSSTGVGGSVGGGSAGGGDSTNVGMVSGVQLAQASTVSAFFVESAGGTGNSNCTETTQGPCTVEDCTLGGGGSGTGGAGAGGAPAAPNAGVITLTGGVRNVTLTPLANGTYPVDTEASTQLFTGGESITMAGAGADVPSFSQAVTAPSLIDLTAPTFVTGNLTVDTTSDLVLSWTGGSTGTTFLRLTGSDASSLVTVECEFDASAGTGTAPTAALSPLQGLSNGTASINNLGTETISAGDWQVLLSLSVMASQSSAMATGTATFN